MKSAPGHESAHLHVSGRALYADDIPLPADALHGAFGLSRIAHGRIRELRLAIPARMRGRRRGRGRGRRTRREQLQHASRRPDFRARPRAICGSAAPRRCGGVLRRRRAGPPRPRRSSTSRCLRFSMFARRSRRRASCCRRSESSAAVRDEALAQAPHRLQRHGDDRRSGSFLFGGADRVRLAAGRRRHADPQLDAAPVGSSTNRRASA